MGNRAICGVFRGRRAALILLAAVLAALLVRVAVVWPATRSSDTFQYLLIADSLARGDGFVSGGSHHPDLTRLPLFPLLVAGASRFGGDAESAARAIVLLFGALTALPLYYLARRTYGPAAGAASLPLAVASGLVLASSRLLPEPVFVFFSLSAVAVAWETGRQPTRLRALGAGLLAGAATVTRIEALALVSVLAFWIAVAGRPARPISRRLGAVGLLLAGFLMLYGPYVLWVSTRLGRVSATPGVQYLQDMRYVSDRLHLRRMDPWVHWTEASRFLPAADREHLVLDVYFHDRTLLDPDPDVEVKLPEGDGTRPRRTVLGLAVRRGHILRANLGRLPYKLHASGLLSFATILLGVAGCLFSLRTPGGRRSLLFLVLVAGASFAPVSSHTEWRFLLVPFTLGLVVSAGGWGHLAARLARLEGGRGRFANVAAHLLLLAAMVLPTMELRTAHRARLDAEPDWSGPAKAAFGSSPPGPILAVRPHVAYDLSRPFLSVPLGGPDLVLDYAANHGAVGLFLDSGTDPERRPQLARLFEEDIPDGFRLVGVAASDGGREGRFFLLEPDARGPGP